jgi:restriction endonuclease S subunit
LPDTWGIGEKFLMLPINAWNKEYQEVHLGGLTCDSHDFYTSEEHINAVFLPKSKRQASFGKDNGLYKFFTSSKDLTKYCDEVDYKETCLIIGTGGNANVKISDNFSCSTDNFIIKNNNSQVLNYYLYYWFINNMIKLEEYFHGSTIKHLSKVDLENIKIPIPSKEIQKHIVEECEYYDNLIDALKKENERLQNNNIIEMVLKSVSSNIEDTESHTILDIDNEPNIEINDSDLQTKKHSKKQSKKTTKKQTELI